MEINMSLLILLKAVLQQSSKRQTWK